MGDRSAIEWTDATWNPVRGCSRVSAGCEHCYAERVAARFSGEGQSYAGLIHPSTRGWNGKITLVPQVLDQPLRWRRPRRIFVNSMSGLFHENVPDAFIDRVFAVMALAPQHTFQVLTKRPERMRDYCANDATLGRVVAEIARIMHGIGDADTRLVHNNDGLRGLWLPNVWLGVSVEDQATADARIPLLLQTPAAVRFLSCEPLLGPIDLSRWLLPIAMLDPDKAPGTWEKWNAKGLWPDWVPQDWRENIERFWGCAHRTPQSWLRSAIQQKAAPHGAMMTSANATFSKEPVTGRFLHTWNNMCVLVDGAGVAHVTSVPRKHLFDPGQPSSSYQNINWVIAGGESGPGARPMHPDWARTLRDQCAAAGVPFFFKQWGEFAPEGLNRERWLVRSDGSHDCMRAPDGIGYHSPIDGAVFMYRVGKKAAGHLLDGREHHAFPEPRS